MTTAKKSLASSILELVVIVAIALGLALAIQAFIVKPYKIPSGSMEPTLHINQRVLVDRIGNNFSSPSVGNIVVFHPPKTYATGCANPRQGENQAGQNGAQPCDMAGSQASSETFIKRVVGLPGDRIQIRGGHVIRNGVPEKDSYIDPCGAGGACTFSGTITVPKGEYYMMGDNRGASDDSRFWGPVPKSWIIGKAFLTYWPPDRIGFM
ncbi:MAG TPA: signal peptidase I [Solirubrobacteraceae bacterium]